MKMIFLIFTLSSFLFPGFWVAYDVSSEVCLEGCDDFDEGAITVGYEGDLEEGKKLTFAVSYDLKGGSFDDSSFESQVLNVFGKYYFTDSEEDVQVWGSLGYGLPMGDLDDLGASGGMSYGLGLNFNKNIGLSYTAINMSVDDSYGYYSYYGSVDLEYNKVALSYSF